MASNTAAASLRLTGDGGRSACGHAPQQQVRRRGKDVREQHAARRAEEAPHDGHVVHAGGAGEREAHDAGGEDDARGERQVTHLLFHPEHLPDARAAHARAAARRERVRRADRRGSLLRRRPARPLVVVPRVVIAVVGAVRVGGRLAAQEPRPEQRREPRESRADGRAAPEPATVEQLVDHVAARQADEREGEEEDDREEEAQQRREPVTLREHRQHVGRDRLLRAAPVRDTREACHRVECKGDGEGTDHHRGHAPA
mmetsp:Transcript_32251/g.95055  ORF Transcript_32251/g.95055 Transcript_32251/m.95055 type:complete len:257 (-) Transcript_32251:828-1598(-)